MPVRINHINDEPRALLIPRRPAFAILGVGTTKGHELINSGQLDARKLGSKTLITMESIKALAASLPRAGAVPAPTNAIVAEGGILDLKPWNRTPSVMPIPRTVSHVVLAPPCRIDGDDPAGCMAAYHDAMRRGPAAAIAITILWSRLLPLAEQRAVARAQADLVKYMRDWTRHRGLPHAFIVSTLERDPRMGRHGHFLVQAHLKDLDDLMDAVERQLRRRYGELPPLTYMRGSRAFPYNQMHGRITSAAMGLGWLRYCLKGSVQADNDLGINRPPGMLDVEGIAIRWGCGMPERDKMIAANDALCGTSVVLH